MKHQLHLEIWVLNNMKFLIFQDGFQCKTNLIYWRAEEYIGVGAEHTLNLDGKRFNRVNGIEEYISSSQKALFIIEDETK